MRLCHQDTDREDKMIFPCNDKEGPQWFLRVTEKKEGLRKRIFHKESKKDRKDIIKDLRKKFERKAKYRGTEK